MSAADLKELFDRVQSWPKAAQEELLSLATAIENAFQAHQHVASDDELQISEAVITSIEATPDAGSSADEIDIVESMQRLVAEKPNPPRESKPDA
ncbi:hypothetical protein [Bradyrhizobium sp. B120]|uniref:hypothetical protein n=1 Tax=Bradyrhizobium sp. B120 TaxID=3410088 RepID=UPI003B985D15